jgi:hypothetical protein
MPPLGTTRGTSPDCLFVFLSKGNKTNQPTKGAARKKGGNVLVRLRLLSLFFAQKDYIFSRNHVDCVLLSSPLSSRVRVFDWVHAGVFRVGDPKHWTEHVVPRGIVSLYRTQRTLDVCVETVGHCGLDVDLATHLSCRVSHRVLGAGAPSRDLPRRGRVVVVSLASLARTLQARVWMCLGVRACPA